MIRNFIVGLVLSVFIIIFYLYSYNQEEAKIMTAKTEAPKAPKVPYSYEVAGHKISDDYFWLRDKDWPKSVDDAAVLEYLQAENQYFDQFIKPRAKDKEKLFKELEGRVKLDDVSTYIKRDDYYYYSRSEADKDYTIYCRKFGSIDAKEEIILDVNELSKGKKFVSVSAFAVSPDHSKLAYSVDYKGDERFTVVVLDLKTREYLADEIDQTIGSVIWHEDNSGFFYQPVDENWRHQDIYFHQLGDKKASDKHIFHEDNIEHSVSIYKSSSKEFFIIDSGNHFTSAVYVIAMDDPSFKTWLVKDKKDNVVYGLDHGDRFYLLTNEQHENFELLALSDHQMLEGSCQLEGKWQSYIAASDELYLADFDITEKFLIMNYKDTNQALPKIKVELIDQRQTVKEVQFPDKAYTAGAYSTNYKEDDIRLSYSSIGRPSMVYNYDYDSEKLSVLKEQEIPSGFDPELYEVERIFIPADDGVEVPVSLFYKKSLFKKDGSNPLYLYGYGSYGISTPPSFRLTAISMVDRGFVFAIAHIRGGSEKGRKWYEAAKFLDKKRTFSDFINVADGLVGQGYTSAGNIVCVGGSAGGLLVGNVINQRPDLFKAAVAHVPFVDVMNTMLDESLPLTPGEYKEWGNPKEPKYFDYMLSYSPYDQVAKQQYPALFVTAGLSDPRVGYWEAAKWVAKLRDMKVDNNPLYLKTNMDFGHKGSSGRQNQLRDAAEDLVFIFAMFDIKI